MGPVRTFSCFFCRRLASITACAVFHSGDAFCACSNHASPHTAQHSLAQVQAT